MSDTDGSYRFLAWVRSGLAAVMPAHSPGDGQSSLQITLTVLTSTPDGKTGNPTVQRPLRLYGPGDVVGLDSKQIIRREPPPNTTGFEPNYFPLVEFDAPELPWLFSPKPGGPQVCPWLTLVVVRREVADILVDPRMPLPNLRLAPSIARQELPDLNESWAWAHAQIMGNAGEKQALGGDRTPGAAPAQPELTLSRILCPRRLQRQQRYLACLVPVYRAGVQAGLGDPVDPGLELAWPSPEGTEHDADWTALKDPFRLPVYDYWEFTTGEVGDFEMLARRLRAKVADPKIGGVDLDISNPDPAFEKLHLNAPTSISFEGVLTAPDSQPLPWPSQEGDFKQQLEELIEAPPGVDLTVLRPPIYGAFQAGVTDKLPAPDAEPLWVRDLNLDPGRRAAAALGTRVVQQMQEELMASAWEQAGELERVNGMLRQAQLARATTTATLEKHIINDGLPADTIVRLIEPLHSRVRLTRSGSTGTPQTPTLRGSVKGSIFPQAAFSPPFRRALRPVGPLGRRLTPKTHQPPNNANDAINAMSHGLATGKLHIPVLPAGGGVHFDEVLGDTLEKPAFKDLGQNLGNGKGWQRIVDKEGGFYTDKDQDPYASSSSLSPESAHRSEAPPEPVPAHATLAATPENISDAPLPVGSTWGIDETGRDFDRLLAINNRFKWATQFLLGHLPPTVSTSPTRDSSLDLELSKIVDQLKARDSVLAPDQTVAREVVGLWDRPPIAPRETIASAPAPAVDPLRPRAATLQFHQPMVEPLLAIDREMLLPGVDRIDADSVGLLLGNSRFIEAYMVGINHELSRELLWRGLPTDLTATFADRFWDIRGRDPQASYASQISSIAGWVKGLGLNTDDVSETGRLVLIIRGRLLQRYPHTAIYAVKAVSNGTSDPTPGTVSDERYPEFRGTIDPDITYVGFKIPYAEARGDDGGPGWFFIIQEQPTAPRFGLDEPDNKPLGDKDSWASLDWSDVVEPGGELSNVRYVRVAGPHAASSAPTTRPVLDQSDTMATWDADAAQMAAITYQRPVRVAILGTTMLPPPKPEPEPEPKEAPP